MNTMTSSRPVPTVAIAQAAPARIEFRPEAVGGTGFTYRILLLFLFLVYLNAGLLSPRLEAIRPLRIVGILAIVSLLLEKACRRERLEWIRPESHLLLGFVATAALSCIGALWPRQAMESTLELAKYAAIYVVMVNVLDDFSKIRATITTIVVGGMIPAIGTIHNWTTGGVVEGRAAWVGIFGNPNDVAYSLVILAPLAVYLAGHAGGLRRILGLAAIGVYVFAIYTTFSRGGLVGLFVVLALVVFRHASASARIWALLLMAASIVFVMNFWSRQQGFSSLGQDYTLNQRLTTIMTGFAMFLDHPLFGVGIGCSVIAWPLYAPLGPQANEGALVTHNTFVQALGETGLPGFLFFVFLLGAVIRRARAIAAALPESEDDQTPALASVLEVSLWGYIVCGFVGGNVLSWFLYILAGLVGAVSKLRDREAAVVEPS